MKITVKYFTILREAVGKKEEELEFSHGTTLKEVLKHLSETYGKAFKEYVYDERGRVRGHLEFLIDGKSITTMKGFETKLNDRDKIAIIPPVGGG
jgi:molybdopterin synthase sulfur carrier subunit